METSLIVAVLVLPTSIFIGVSAYFWHITHPDPEQD